jgi:uncharacterized protein (TIGR02453 family)
MGFRGFPPEALAFYERLEADNSKAFWQANRATYDQAVVAPMNELCAALAEYGPFHLFRPYNDLRFAKGRPPYKTAQGAVGEGEGGSHYYVQISAEGLMAGAGYYHMAKDQLERFRAAVDRDATGEEVETLGRSVVAGGYQLGAIDELKTAPRGYAKDHPRADLLRRKGLMAWRSWPLAKWLHTTKAADRVRALFTDAGPLCAWLDRHVGPSTLPPPDAER